MVAYNRGDYVQAIRLFRPLAEAGNSKAKNQIGLMYRKGARAADDLRREQKAANAYLLFHVPPVAVSSIRKLPSACSIISTRSTSQNPTEG